MNNDLQIPFQQALNQEFWIVGFYLSLVILLVIFLCLSSCKTNLPMLWGIWTSNENMKVFEKCRGKYQTFKKNKK